MCGAIVEESVQSNSITISSKPASLSENEKRQATRVFRSLGSKLLYILSFDGSINFVGTSGDRLEESSQYYDEDGLLEAAEKGDLVELVQPEPVIAADPDEDDEDDFIEQPFTEKKADGGLNDRLIAAQDETGFTLFDVVQVRDGGEFGKIVGFGRVNFPAGNVERALLVQFSGTGVTDMEVVAVSPVEVDLVASQPAPF